MDADFNAGSQLFKGNVITNLGIAYFNGNVLTLTAQSNNAIYQYQEQTGQGLSFVLSLLTNRQISSTTGPTAGGLGNQLPVLVFDPNGNNDPYLYE